jgi:hypothetical protein
MEIYLLRTLPRSQRVRLQKCINIDLRTAQINKKVARLEYLQSRRVVFRCNDNILIDSRPVFQPLTDPLELTIAGTLHKPPLQHTLTLTLSSLGNSLFTLGPSTSPHPFDLFELSRLLGDSEFVRDAGEYEGEVEIRVRQYRVYFKDKFGLGCVYRVPNSSKLVLLPVEAQLAWRVLYRCVFERKEDGSELNDRAVNSRLSVYFFDWFSQLSTVIKVLTFADANRMDPFANHWICPNYVMDCLKETSWYLSEVFEPLIVKKQLPTDLTCSINKFHQLLKTLTLESQNLIETLQSSNPIGCPAYSSTLSLLKSTVSSLTNQRYLYNSLVDHFSAGLLCNQLPEAPVQPQHVKSAPWRHSKEFFHHVTNLVFRQFANNESGLDGTQHIDFKTKTVSPVANQADFYKVERPAFSLIISAQSYRYQPSDLTQQPTKYSSMITLDQYMPIFDTGNCLYFVSRGSAQICYFLIPDNIPTAPTDPVNLNLVSNSTTHLESYWTNGLKLCMILRNNLKQKLSVYNISAENPIPKPELELEIDLSEITTLPPESLTSFKSVILTPQGNILVSILSNKLEAVSKLTEPVNARKPWQYLSILISPSTKSLLSKYTQSLPSSFCLCTSEIRCSHLYLSNHRGKSYSIVVSDRLRCLVVMARKDTLVPLVRYSSLAIGRPSAHTAVNLGRGEGGLPRVAVLSLLPTKRAEYDAVGLTYYNLFL